jgi:hypothetical protein
MNWSEAMCIGLKFFLGRSSPLVNDQHIDRLGRLADCRRGEKPRSLIASVRSLLADPRNNRVRVLIDSSSTPHVLIGERDVESSSPTICLLRLFRTMQAPTLAHFITSRVIDDWG